jgi:SpoVK/Ycf46/Vps4 family AAA+-type ATPase
MMRTLPGQTTSVRYKDEVFEQIVSSLRYQAGTAQATQLVFTGSARHQMKLAAKALATRLGKQLYSIDLSAVKSKYIGETEKNLSRVLDRASGAGWILFFDEADALFGKRTHVRDAHDKYANQETSYLLQKLEQYKGIVILTTQSKSNIDTQKKRNRMRKIVVKFPP